MAHEALNYGDFATIDFTRKFAAEDRLPNKLRLVVQAEDLARRVQEVFSFRDAHPQLQLAVVVRALMNTLLVRGLRRGLKDVRLARRGHLPLKSCTASVLLFFCHHQVDFEEVLRPPGEPPLALDDLVLARVDNLMRRALANRHLGLLEGFELLLDLRPYAILLATIRGSLRAAEALIGQIDSIV